MTFGEFLNIYDTSDYLIPTETEVKSHSDNFVMIHKSINKLMVAAPQSIPDSGRAINTKRIDLASRPALPVWIVNESRGPPAE